jgi:hypothetical protein
MSSIPIFVQKQPAQREMPELRLNIPLNASCSLPAK